MGMETPLSAVKTLEIDMRSWTRNSMDNQVAMSDDVDLDGQHQTPDNPMQM